VLGLKWIKWRGAVASSPLVQHFVRNKRDRNRLVAGIAVFALLAGGLIFTAARAHGSTTILLSSFDGPSNGITEATNHGWVVGGTGTVSGSTWTPVMADGPDSDNDVDRLRLVGRNTYTVGYALYDVPQTTSAGLDIKFNMAMSQGGNASSTNTLQADGISFYLKDGNDAGNTASSLGAKCDGLGYAARRTAAGDGCQNNGQNGLSGGLLGIGFDAWGDAYKNAWDGAGCTNGDPGTTGYPKFMILRGPQGNTRTDGYCRISSPQDTISGTTNKGVDLSSTNLFNNDGSGSAVRITIDTQDRSGGRNNGTGRVYIASAGTTNWSSVSASAVFELPEALANATTFKFGFAAGTGGNFMKGEIWGTTVNSIRDLPAPTWITPATLCTVTNVAFSQQLQMQDGVAPYSYSTTSGSLPPGLTLTSGGLLSGTPTTAGTYNFTVRGSDSSPAGAINVDRAFSMNIQSNECATMAVTMAATKQITNNNADFNLQNRLTLPGSWSASQYIAAEVALATSAADNAPAYRGPGSCLIDISSDVNAGTYGTAEANGSQTLSNGSGAVWVMNDRTAEVTLYGRADYVREALKNVRATCGTTDDLNGKYVRFGAVPSVAPWTVDSWSMGLFYAFSTQHYYTFAKIGSSPAQGGTWATNYTRISQLMINAHYDTITVDGKFTSVSADARRHGWVSTLTSQDEILLSEAFRPQTAAATIGMTDVGTSNTAHTGITNEPDANAQSWDWDTTNWGTRPSGASATCSTKEGYYRWLGPDSWCGQIPAPGPGGNYWKLDSSTGLWSPGTSTDRTIDLTSTNSDCSLDPCNGFGLYHRWYRPSDTSAITEPNQSGDYIYSGYGGSMWDDALPSDGYELYTALSNGSYIANYYFSEFCSGVDDAHSCAPADAAVAATQLVAVDTSVRLNWEINSNSPSTLGNSTQDATCTNGTVTQTTGASYRTVVLTNSGLGTANCTWTRPTGVDYAEVFLVGGGGGGGYDSGGGGGGGSQTLHSSFNVTSNATIVVGAGGANGASSGTWQQKSGSAGGDTTFTASGVTVTARGGGGGGACIWLNNVCTQNGNGNAGGSGGSTSGSNGTLSIAGASGGNGQFNSINPQVATSGSNGSSWQPSGVRRAYGGGGAGAGAGTISGGTGGGASSNQSTTPLSGTPGTGGGGAGGTPASRGGSGIVVIKYAIPMATNTVSVVANVTTSSSNSISTSATVKRQWATLTDSTCGTSWTTEATSITSLPNTASLTRGRCYRWTVDSGLASGAVRPVDSQSISPTSNLTSPVLMLPAEATITVPSVVPVDPRDGFITLPPVQLSSSGPGQYQLCVYESGSSTLSGLGTTATGNITFDVGTLGSVQTSVSGATVDGDRTSSITIRGSQSAVQSAAATIRANLASGNFTSSKYILMRAVPFITNFTSSCTSTGGNLNAISSGASLFETRPLNLGTKQQVEIRLGN
jgi:hypothetical protein